jgi:hypothetical protein
MKARRFRDALSTHPRFADFNIYAGVAGVVLQDSKKEETELEHSVSESLP